MLFKFTKNTNFYITFWFLKYGGKQGATMNRKSHGGNISELSSNILLPGMMRKLSGEDKVTGSLWVYTMTAVVPQGTWKHY